MTAINHLFRSELKVINVGLAGFKQALDDARVPAVQVDWKPSVEVEAKLLQRVRAAQRRNRAGERPRDEDHPGRHAAPGGTGEGD